MSFPSIIDKLARHPAAISFDVVEIVGVVTLGTVSTENHGVVHHRNDDVPTVVINAVAIPPYTPSLAPDTVLPGPRACVAMALPPYAELVVIVVLPDGVFDRTDRRGVTHTLTVGHCNPT